MHDVELYERILGLSSPWRGSDVKLDVADGQVEILVDLENEARWSCPHCVHEAGGYDHAPERSWRHLDNIVLYYTHGLTNAASEGINSKIMAIKRRAAGLRNSEHFKTAI